VNNVPICQCDQYANAVRYVATAQPIGTLITLAYWHIILLAH